jgi:transposase-like protein
MNYRSEVAAVKKLSAQIERGEDAIEAAKWERAERVAALVVAGYSRREIADDLGVSQVTVSTWVKIWEAHGGGGVHAREHLRYADADYEAGGRGAGFNRPEPAQKIAERVANDPALAQAIVSNRKANAAVTKAIVANVREEADLRTGSPDGLKPPASVQVIGEFAALRSATVRAVSRLGTVRLSGMLREEVEAELDRIDAAIGMARDLITDRKAADWDSALAELMTGGN